MSIALNYFKDN